VSTPGPKRQAAGEALVRRMLAGDAFSRWLGVEVVDLGPGRCTLRMNVRREMVNGFGVAHGGIAYSLADSALAFASNAGADGFVTVSIQNSISYPTPVHPGNVLTATAVEESAANRIAFYTVNVRNEDGVVVALFRGTVYRTRRDLGAAEGVHHASEAEPMAEPQDNPQEEADTR
jgi:acyl-CoA thioesterase